MLIAIDYDFTYTLDPAFWDKMIHAARARGHGVVCITNREQPPAADEPQPPVEVICSPEHYKSDMAARHRLVVDVWIDDAPGTIEQGRFLDWSDEGEGG